MEEKCLSRETTQVKTTGREREDVVKDMKKGEHGWGAAMEVMMDGPGWALQATIESPLEFYSNFKGASEG